MGTNNCKLQVDFQNVNSFLIVELLIWGYYNLKKWCYLIMLISLIDYVNLVTSNTIEIIWTVHITEEGVFSCMRVLMGVGGSLDG